VHRRHAGGSRRRLRPERPAGSPRRGARRPAHAQLEPGLHLRRQCRGGHVMSDRVTRQDFLRRAAVGGSILTVPGLLAACGGGKKAAATSSSVAKTLPKTITFSNWPLYIDINDKTKTHPSLQQFDAHYHVNVRYIEDIND